MESSEVKVVAVLLTVLLFFGILTIWVPGRWAVGLLEAGIFLLGIVWAAGTMWQPHQPKTSFPLIPLAGAVLWRNFPMPTGGILALIR